MVIFGWVSFGARVVVAQTQCRSGMNMVCLFAVVLVVCSIFSRSKKYLWRKGLDDNPQLAIS